MKKFLLLILVSIATFAYESIFAISYNASPSVIYPVFSTDYGNYTASATYDYGIVQNSNNRVKSMIYSQTTEVDLTQLDSASGAILINFWYVNDATNTQTLFFWNLYLSWATVVATLHNSVDGWVTNFLIEKITYPVHGLTVPYSSTNFPGYFPKRFVVIFSFGMKSYDPLFGFKKNYLRSISSTFFSSESYGFEKVYTNTPDGLQVWSNYWYWLSPFWSNIPGAYATFINNMFNAWDLENLMPFITSSPNSSTFYFNTLWNWSRQVWFGDMTSNIVDIWSGSTLPLESILSDFYTWDPNVDYTMTGSTGGGSTWSGIFDDCSALQIGCYIEKSYYAIRDWIGGFFPDISFSWEFNACGSWSTISSTGSYLQKFANVIAIVNPFPPEEWTNLCLLVVWSWVLDYQRLIPEENFFAHYIPGEVPMLEGDGRVVYWQTVVDIFVIIVFTMIIFYSKHHD